MSTVTEETDLLQERDAELLVEGRLGALVEGLDERGRPKQEVWVDLIREGFGNARDKHYYPAEALREASRLFYDPESGKGAKMYVNHLDPEAQAKLKGMPRDVQDLGGRIREVRMGTNAEGKPTLQGRVSISQPWLWQLVEHDPELIGVSINARGSSRPGQVDGREAKIVEGIHRVISVDWVTEAGAGGKVVSFVEAQLREEGREDEIMGIEQLTEEAERSGELLDEEGADPQYYGNVTPTTVAGPSGHNSNRLYHGREHPGPRRDEQDFDGRPDEDWEPYGFDDYDRDARRLPGYTPEELGRGRATAMHGREHYEAEFDLEEFDPEELAEMETVIALDEMAEAGDDGMTEAYFTHHTELATGRRRHHRHRTHAEARRHAEQLEHEGHAHVRITRRRREGLGRRGRLRAHRPLRPRVGRNRLHEADTDGLCECGGALRECGDGMMECASCGKRIARRGLREADFDPGYGYEGSFMEGYDESFVEDGETVLDPEVSSGQSSDGPDPELSAAIEARAREIAREHLREAVARAADTLREEYESRLAEQADEFARRLAQVEQRQLTASIIETSGLPDPSRRALKAELYDAYFEAEVTEDGSESRSAEDVLTEAVNSKIEARREELSVFSEARVTGAGPTVASSGGSSAGRSAPTKAPTDEKINKSLGID